LTGIPSGIAITLFNWGRLTVVMLHMTMAEPRLSNVMSISHSFSINSACYIYNSIQLL